MENKLVLHWLYSAIEVSGELRIRVAILRNALAYVNVSTFLEDVSIITKI
jgi:hypothetical protein